VRQQARSTRYWGRYDFYTCPSSRSRSRSHTAAWITSVAALYSALHDESDTVFCLFDDQGSGQLPNSTTNSAVDFEILGSSL
jgi:hypothetical protein